MPYRRPGECCPPRRHSQLEPSEAAASLVHLTDGVAGGRRRIATAEQVLTRDFGIGTECGFGRRPKATVPDLLRLHARLAERTS